MSREQLLARNPLARAQVKRAEATRNAQALDDFQDSLRTARVLMYALEDGQDATEALAFHGFHLALAAQTAVKVEGPGSAVTRRLHMAVRNIHAMCLAGYRWQYALAPVVEAALTEGVDFLLQHPHEATQWLSAAETWRRAILDHTVRRDDIAGAELYRAQPDTQDMPKGGQTC
jgi:hypothetical protein